MKKNWMMDALLGLTLTLVVTAFAFFQTSFTEAFENRLYDLRLKFAPKAPLSDQILFVAIDDASIASIGRWPWPRGVVADLLRRVAAGSPKVIGLNIFYTEPEQNQGLEMVRELKGKYTELYQSEKNRFGPLLAKINKDARYAAFTKPAPLNLDAFAAMDGLFSEAEVALDNDSQLAQALMETPGVVLPMFFAVDKPLANETDELLDRMRDYALIRVKPADGPGSLTEGYQPLLPLADFAQGATGMGHANIFQDLDGSVRRETLIIRYRDHYLPSLALEMARVALGIAPEKVEVALGHQLVLGDKKIPLGTDNTMLINFLGPYSSIKVVPAVDILADKVTPESFKDKLVLLGPTATGLGALFVTPVAANFPSNAVVAMVLQNILGGHFLTRPEWAPMAELALLAIIGLFVTFVLPHLRAQRGAVLSSALFLLIASGGVYAFVTHGWWLKIFYGLILLALAYTLITVRRFFFTERRKELVEAESIETNKMLGLSFQGQGMLDMAFEKFRKCPVDEAMKELLYNLALDFERKRQFAKAAVIYEHIGKFDMGYKDIKERQKTMKTAGETMIVGPLGGGKKDGTVVLEGAAAKPTLGRYEIQKELGRGAMGVVYLGKDPKINRMVAIKTLKFDDDVEEAAIKQLKERFFTEAESAGTLNHPNIVRIFDAGEDNEICYIAMELLDGEDLKKYGEKANLLPPEQVMDYVAITADALDFAHAAGVVHRDIKPANIMLLKNGSLRVTDFGIARITASSKTQTGTVMGTPSYMSPEQVAGRKVDGRADIFSLGVMFYEMMVGEKPFEGDSIATLLFRISSEAHPDPVLKSDGRVTPAIKAIIDKALQKSPDHRYQKAAEMAKDIREALKNPDFMPAGAPPAQSGASTASASPAAASETIRLAPPSAAATNETVRLPPKGAGADETLKL